MGSYALLEAARTAASIRSAYDKYVQRIAVSWEVVLLTNTPHLGTHVWLCPINKVHLLSHPFSSSLIQRNLDYLRLHL